VNSDAEGSRQEQEEEAGGDGRSGKDLRKTKGNEVE
jgi:hypothetical protein